MGSFTLASSPNSDDRQALGRHVGALSSLPATCGAIAPRRVCCGPRGLFNFSPILQGRTGYIGDLLSMPNFGRKGRCNPCRYRAAGISPLPWRCEPDAPVVGSPSLVASGVAFPLVRRTFRSAFALPVSRIIFTARPQIPAYNISATNVFGNTYPDVLPSLDLRCRLYFPVSLRMKFSSHSLEPQYARNLQNKCPFDTSNGRARSLSFAARRAKDPN